MPYNDLGKNSSLKSGTGGGVAGVITHVGIHTLTDPGTGTNANAGEATGGSPVYARKAVTWGTPGTPAQGQVANTGAMAWDVPPGSYGFFTFWNNVTGNTNNYLGYAPINGVAKGFGTVDSAGATADAIQSAGHGLANNDRVMVLGVFAESLPAGLTEGVIYYVVSAATDTFEVSTTQGGASENITGQGELYWQKVVPETFGSQGQITADVGALILDATGI